MDNVSDKPIRVAQIIGKMWAGGVESVVFNYYRAIDKTKVQFDFFYDSDSTVDPPADLIVMGAKFHKLPPYQQIFSYIRTLRKLLTDNQYVIVHSHLNTLSSIPLYAAWRAKVKIRIAHNHSVPGGSEWRRNILKQILRRFIKIFSTDYFACSEKAGRWLFGNKAYNAGNVYLMRNAVDFKRFTFDEEKRNRIRKKLRIEDKMVIGHVGRFTFAKNHEYLLDIFVEVHKKIPESVLILVGDGELWDQIIEKIKRIGIEEQVLLIGKTSVPEDYYPVIDVMIVPSVFEGLSMTTIESQISGIPTLISEAVPDETIISNGIIRRSLRENASEWAGSCMNAVGKKVVLSEKSRDYSIDRQVGLLCDWYINKFKSYCLKR